MKEIVINKCHGGFGLSHKAVMQYAEIKGFKLYPWIDDITKTIYGDRATINNPEIWLCYTTEPRPKNPTNEWINKHYFSEYNIPRDDPGLVQVVRELKDEANGKCSVLAIVEIPDDVDWEIDEYDGVESIVEKHRSWG